MKDFFISYNRVDRKAAEWIAWQLEEEGYAVIIQAWDFGAGSNFVLDMHQALKDALATIIVLSPDFLSSRFTAPEWAAAFAQDPTGTRGRLIPVRMRECQPNGLLGQINYIDLVGCQDRDTAKKRLLKGVSQRRAKPEQEPELPHTGIMTPSMKGIPEPQWPPTFAQVTEAAGNTLWRIARMLLVILTVALLASRGFSYSLPTWFANHTSAAYSYATTLGILAMLVVEGGARLIKRLKARANPSASK